MVFAVLLSYAFYAFDLPYRGWIDDRMASRYNSGPRGPCRLARGVLELPVV